MANAKPTLWNTELASTRRHDMSDFERLRAAFPSIVIDPNTTRIESIAEHPGTMGGPVRFWSVKQAVERKLIEVIDHGFKQAAFIKSSRVEVVIGPSEGLLRVAARC